jgi:hypothetical protein
MVFVLVGGGAEAEGADQIFNGVGCGIGGMRLAIR